MPALAETNEPRPQLLRIDFVPKGSRCAKPGCTGQHLTVAHIVRAANGAESYYGSECIKKLGFTEAELSGTPDLTKRFQSERVGRGTSATRSGCSAGHAPSQAKAAKEYLWLRFGLVADLCPDAKGLRYAPLVPVFQQLKDTGQISTEDVQWVLALEDSRHTPMKFRWENLMDVHTAAWQLSEQRDATGSTSYREFLQCVLDYLRAKLSLSARQIDTTNLKLHRTAFTWAHKRVIAPEVATELLQK